MDNNNIRNFVIISHIDHGKSTLADRFLEITKTVDSRNMKAQYLDSLESERERGITIKMAPVRMKYAQQNNEYILNLIDTPGHPDFGYEVSRALAAVEGAILLVDASQGIQAQTLAKFYSAKKQGLKIIGAVNKIDLTDKETVEKEIKELAGLIDCQPEEIHKISGKTGEGVEELLEAIIKEIPSPKFQTESASSKALIFDSFYNDHKGIVAGVRVFNGEFKISDNAYLIAVGQNFKIKELGYFKPQMESAQKISNGEIGYIATGVKETEKIKIGDTIISSKFKVESPKLLALPGYQEPNPVVFVSFYPENGDDFDNFKKSLERLKLNDSALRFEPDKNEVLGRGFKIGFLGKLHFEITVERLEKEFNIKVINSFPSVSYNIKKKGNQEYVRIESAGELPDDFEEILEPIIKIEIIAPTGHLGSVLGLKEHFRMEKIETKNLGERILISAEMPLAELISDFDDRLKSVSQGFASFNYEFADYRKADLKKLEILVAGSKVAGLSKIIPEERIEREARKMVEKLKEILPRQQFSQAIQAVSDGRIVARETAPAMKKDVAGYLYGGDRTRKMKLWKKQKKGKKKLLEMANVQIPAEIFKKMIQ
ncbi:MAG: translation elongation factor 4 [Patescibacteria group bacterium]